jgi:hypothetical protein
MSKERLTAEEMLEKSFNSSDLRRITFIPDIKAITDLMQSFADQEVETAIAERMPTEEDAIRYAADYATELDASEEPHTDIEKMDTFLHGTRWFRSRMEEKK